MNVEKEIYTGLYLFGNMKLNTSCGGVSAVIKVPTYNSNVLFFINDSHVSEEDSMENAKCYKFNLEELESIQKAIERALNDIRNLESLSRRNLLKDKAYRNPI
ncbi:TPA: hypothetical protein JQR05_004061 [Shigella flexneri]|uniref:Uncharacterized protein n=2 Tax=Escherichia coli TaxID=562 RepID=A0A8S7EBY7_ECOLX|nr:MULTISPECIES: hypothetical protein [Enterobacteriaceae]KAE9897700.1 hypothetical protein GP696_07910 [Enterobacteriaceae bacterium TzEc052]MVX82292.1 hypothetical protein [Enterobacteriaceae bacterium 8376wD9]MVY11124.1 hypothetical protein [Enterobacteriaceae bacterium 8376wH8]MVY25483.1 hypothetical protein [Enterobacteriaceae bacterium 8376wB8]MVY30994.1 hypothetical protein [Enterobacteriaceae bacterium 8376wD8]MVY91686.1 hypothetical protein [Enterobacteriaceae bacterium 8376wD7]MVZ0